jgi:hypothetical protein
MLFVKGRPPRRHDRRRRPRRRPSPARLPSPSIPLQASTDAPAALGTLARARSRTIALASRQLIVAARMSLLRTLVASTSALPSAVAAAACSTSSVRRLAMAATETSSSSSSTSSVKMHIRWAHAVPRAAKARLPPVVVPRGPDQPKPVHPPRAPLETPAKFIAAIGRGLEKKLKGKVDLETMAWEDLMNWRGKDWSQKGGLESKDRQCVSSSSSATLSCEGPIVSDRQTSYLFLCGSRYLSWLIKMYKKGHDPRRLAIEPKPPKKYRACVHSPVVFGSCACSWSVR